jgi:hypothetical protein
MGSPYQSGSFRAAAFGFLSVMHVNADGAPMSYNKEDTGWSYLYDSAVAFDGRRCVFPPERGGSGLARRHGRAYWPRTSTARTKCVLFLLILTGNYWNPITA